MLAKMRKPQCTAVHEDFRIERNAESALFNRQLSRTPMSDPENNSDGNGDIQRMFCPVLRYFK